MQTIDDSAQGLNARCATAVLSNPHVEAGLNSTAVLHGAMSELYAAGAAAGTNGLGKLPPMGWRRQVRLHRD